MKKKLLITGLALVIIVALAGIAVAVPNPLGDKVISRAKAMGYIPYSADEAMELAYTRCANCHDTEKILKYCSRCGPPIITVTHFMRKYIEMSRLQGLEIDQFTDAEIVTITQVWNALVGNWEKDWPKEDIKKLLGNDHALIRLLDTPIEERPIEVALKGKSATGSYQRYGLGK